MDCSREFELHIWFRSLSLLNWTAWGLSEASGSDALLHEISNMAAECRRIPATDLYING